MTTLAIIGARIIDPASGHDEIGDMLVEHGKIVARGTDIFAQGIPSKAQTIDANGLMLTPGLIDMRVITGELGVEHKETLASAGVAAAAGGVTSMVVMPQTNPVIDDISLVNYIAMRGRETSPVNVYAAGALTKGLNNTAMTELGMMSEAGAVMFFKWRERNCRHSIDAPHYGL